MYNLVTWAKENKIAILGITDTNISNNDGKFLDKDLQVLGYKSFWTNRDQKVKGSGCAILIQTDWAKHVGSIKTVSAYILEVKLFFKGITITILQVYAPPQNAAIQSLIIDRIRSIKSSKSREKSIIMGDLNAIVDKNLDKRGGNNKPHKLSPLLRELIQRNYIDTYREMNPDGNKYTWSNNRQHPDIIQTRIDYIWAEECWYEHLVGSDITSSELITGSDHNIVLTTLDTKELIRNNLTARKHNKAKDTMKRKSFRYDEITKEQWLQYKNRIDNIIKSKCMPDGTCGLIREIKRISSQETVSLQDISMLWRNITDIFNRAIEDTIPYIEVYPA